MKGFGDKTKSKKKRITSYENKKSNYDQLINKAFQLQAKGKNQRQQNIIRILLKMELKIIEFFLIMEHSLKKLENIKKQSWNSRKQLN